MSTEHQQYFTENQHAAIQRYADEHGQVIVRMYGDAGKSGLPDGRHHRRLALEHRREHPIPGGGEEINRLFVRTGRSSAKNLAVRNVSGCMKVWRLKGL
jgi:hypothetical protein